VYDHEVLKGSEGTHLMLADFLSKSLLVSNMMLCCCVTAQIGNTQSELKKLAEQNPELKDAYIAKQRRLKVSLSFFSFFLCLHNIVWCF